MGRSYGQGDVFRKGKWAGGCMWTRGYGQGDMGMGMCAGRGYRQGVQAEG